MQIVFVNGDCDDAIKVNTSTSLMIISGRNPQDLDMVSELQGNSHVIKKLAKYSRDNALVICCLCRAKVYSKTYLSCIVVDNGKLIGTSDMTHRISPELLLDRGHCYRIYQSSMGNFGVIVGDDIFFPEVPRLMRTSQAQYLVYLSSKTLDNTTRLAIKANSLFNGTYTLYSLSDECGIVGLYGNSVGASTDFCAEFELTMQSDDRLIHARRTDIYNDLYRNDEN